MNSAIAVIGKNLILIGLVFLSTFNFMFGWLNIRELLGVQSLVGLAYIFLSCYEYLNASYKASLPVQRYPYFTSKFIMFRALKIAVFISFAILLFASRTSIKYIYPICIIIAGTEGVILYLKYKKGLCFVNVYANYILIMESRVTKLFASEILLIEFRHGIFYFVKKNRKTVSIKLEHIRYHEAFVQAINSWINRNNILVSAESKVKISELIA
ncbi:hypothetical protein [Aurantibacillus circumpalustris]|uniref:hypothetical protein n=1 Tax=Aurantibacillus circumpalustris TaxID=3036359 RepID=UPI00295B014C|nr:hypothetical protein [Aurantibacillus circumpalustris]